MADINDTQAAGTVKIVGSDSTGVEQTPVQSTTSGALHTNLRTAAGVEILPATEATLAALLAKTNIEFSTFTVLAPLVVVGNNKSMIALQNTGTGVVKIRKIYVVNSATTAVSGVAGIFNVARITSFSAGTALTPAAFDTLDTLPAGITVSTGSTVVGESSILKTARWSTDEWGPGGLDVEANDHSSQQFFSLLQQQPYEKALTIRQNQGVHIKFATNSTAGSFDIQIVFTVE
jgi:hypothetical protein